MHGMINRAIQCFARARYGDDLWQQVRIAAQAPPEGFEALLTYDDAVTERVLREMTQRLRRTRGEFLEDLGLWLVASPETEAVRRMLRFGGTRFSDFLLSLESVPDRARLALPDLSLPRLVLVDHGPGTFRLHYSWHKHGFSDVLVGMLRAMADDYGALALIERDEPEQDGRAVIGVSLLDSAFAGGRSFDLVRIAR